jgi:hypothetical protein
LEINGAHFTRHPTDLALTSSRRRAFNIIDNTNTPAVEEEITLSQKEKFFNY